MTIHLHQLQFFGYHGLYHQETTAGGTYLVNIDVETTDPAQVITHIADTVNYVEVYELVKARMAQPTALLETLAMELSSLILEVTTLIIAVTVQIKKMEPPICNFVGEVGVTYVKRR